jgi:hypothetical protein
LLKENAKLEAELFSCRETISKYAKPTRASNSSFSGQRPSKPQIVKISRSSANLSENASLHSKTKTKRPSSPLRSKVVATAQMPMIRPPKGKKVPSSEKRQFIGDIKENVISINTNLKTVHLQNSLDSDVRHSMSPKSASQRFIKTGEYTSAHY